MHSSIHQWKHSHSEIMLWARKTTSIRLLPGREEEPEKRGTTSLPVSCYISSEQESASSAEDNELDSVPRATRLRATRPRATRPTVFTTGYHCHPHRRRKMAALTAGGPHGRGSGVELHGDLYQIFSDPKRGLNTLKIAPSFIRTTPENDQQCNVIHQ